MGDPAGSEGIAYWKAQAGPRWVHLQEQIDRMLGPLGHRTMERARVSPGQRVLDVGCGCGDSTLDLAQRVAPHGRAVGVDVSGPMLARAAERARASTLRNVEFVEADAQTHPFPAAGFDLVFSRFGVMFFAAPEAAFANLRRALAGGGRLAFACWRGTEVNPWLTVPMRAVRELVELPAPAPPGAPGPFAFADADQVRAILETAGFRDVACAPVDAALSLGGGVEAGAAADFILRLGQAGAAAREAGVDPARLRDAVTRALAPFSTRSGVELPCGAWIVSAVS